MIRLIKDNQLELMLMFSGVCGIIALFSLFSQTLPQRRRRSMLTMDISAMLLLLADRYSYIYRGVLGQKAYYAVRIGNFTVYFLSLVLLLAYSFYLADLYTADGGQASPPKRLKAAELLSFAGMVLVVISQFTGLYYTFDDMNRYQRGSGFIICCLIPFSVFIIQLSLIIQNFKKLHRKMSLTLLVFTALPLAASIIQIFTYGLSLTNLMLVGMIVALYVASIVDINRKTAEAAKRDIELLQNQQKDMRIMLGQTAYALADAIDAKDEYTHGHSERVAEYSEMIALEAGKPPVQCKEIYFIALLHDVGKIGIPGSIINKTSRLTDEEFQTIKSHTVRGDQILSKITKYPELSIGAHFHHERYDGKGYPTGLSGEDIPEIARIIAVADAYDAMTSNRSYRSALPQEVVRAEIEKGLGTQFDPRFGRIMLDLIDKDKNYIMRQRDS